MFQAFEDEIDGDLVTARLCSQPRGDLTDLRLASTRWERNLLWRRRHKTAAPLLRGNYTQGLQLPIGPGDCVRIDVEPLMQRPHSWQLVALRQPTRGNGSLYVMNDLLVGREAGMKFESPRVDVHVY